MWLRFEKFCYNLIISICNLVILLRFDDFCCIFGIFVELCGFVVRVAVTATASCQFPLLTGSVAVHIFGQPPIMTAVAASL